MAEGDKAQDTAFWNAQDGVRGRDGGPYADEVDAQQREIARARAEGREPDLDNPPPFVGNQLRTSRTVEDNVYSNPSMVNAPGPVEQVEGASVVDEAFYRVDPGVLPVDTRTVLPDSERKESEKNSAELVKDPANVATTSSAQVGDDSSGSVQQARRSGSTATKKSTSKSAAKRRTSS
jgi:hypothetical protein